MIDKVEIIIGDGISTQETIYINNIIKKAYINGEVKKIPENYADRLIEIVKYWKNEYGTSEGLEKVEFKLSIYGDNIEETYHGKGMFPNNYDELIELLGELHD